MLSDWTRDELEAVHWSCENLLRGLALVQAKRRERGGYARPGMADTVRALETRLLASYDRLEREIAASLTGPNDDLHSGRLAQEEAVDPHRLAAVLALLLLWKNRHAAIAEEFARQMFTTGRAKALTEIGLPAATPLNRASVALRELVIARYEGDIGRLAGGLENGTSRSQGLAGIVTAGGALAAALAAIHALFDAERFRVEMFAESVTWTAFLDGYRSGAVDGTQEKIGKLGYASVAAMPPDLLRELPHYVWTGPADEKTCDPCMAQFGHPILALSLEDLPRPDSVCAFGLACRHWFELASD